MDTMADDVEAATEYLSDFDYVGAQCSAILGYLQVIGSAHTLGLSHTARLSAAPSALHAGGTLGARWTSWLQWGVPYALSYTLFCGRGTDGEKCACVPVASFVLSCGVLMLFSSLKQLFSSPLVHRGLAGAGDVSMAVVDGHADGNARRAGARARAASCDEQWRFSQFAQKSTGFGARAGVPTPIDIAL